MRCDWVERLGISEVRRRAGFREKFGDGADEKVLKLFLHVDGLIEERLKRRVRFMYGVLKS